MRVLGVCGSLSEKSANRALLATAVSAAPPGIEVVLFEGVRALPHFDPDLDSEKTPEPVQVWRNAIRESDALLIATPEYGHSLPGSLKNAIDWLIGSGELYQKPVAITAAVSAPERGRRGLAALHQTLSAADARVVGGAPIVRGPHFEGEVRRLLRSLFAPQGR